LWVSIDALQICAWDARDSGEPRDALVYRKEDSYQTVGNARQDKSKWSVTQYDNAT